MHFLRKGAQLRITYTAGTFINDGQQTTKDKPGAFFVYLVRNRDKDAQPIIFAMGPNEAGTLVYNYDHAIPETTFPPHPTGDTIKYLSFKQTVKNIGGKDVVGILVNMTETTNGNTRSYAMALSVGEYTSLVYYVKQHLTEIWAPEAPMENRNV